MGQLVSGTQRSNTMFTRVLVLLLPTLSLSQVTLFRQASHTGPLSSHHAHEVHDLTSSHTRHHSSTPGGLRVISQAPALVSHAVQRDPSLWPLLPLLHNSLFLCLPPRLLPLLRSLKTV